MNKIIIMGNVGRDPELKTTQSNQKYVHFSVAVSRSYKGEKTTQWFNVTAWNKTAEYVSKYVAKGHRILVEGRWDVHEGVDKDTGAKREFGGITASHVQGLGKAAREVEEFDSEPFEAQPETVAFTGTTYAKPEPTQPNIDGFGTDEIPF